MIGIYEYDKYILIDTKNNYTYHTKTNAKNLEICIFGCLNVITTSFLQSITLCWFNQFVQNLATIKTFNLYTNLSFLTTVFFYRKPDKRIQ